jgi:DHA1 family bicyclomycin/chloramphenicol resistance-like MFS transporter
MTSTMKAVQDQNGLRPMPFALFFASTALAQVLLSVVNAKIVGRLRPRTLIGLGLVLCTLAVAALTVVTRAGSPGICHIAFDAELTFR